MGNRHPPSWTGFPDPKNKGSELRDHVFEILADRLATEEFEVYRPPGGLEVAFKWVRGSGLVLISEAPKRDDHRQNPEKRTREYGPMVSKCPRRWHTDPVLCPSTQTHRWAGC